VDLDNSLLIVVRSLLRKVSLCFEYLKARSKESFPLLASFPSLIL
jgi:hypothetical protein